MDSVTFFLMDWVASIPMEKRGSMRLEVPAMLAVPEAVVETEEVPEMELLIGAGHTAKIGDWVVDWFAVVFSVDCDIMKILRLEAP